MKDCKRRNRNVEKILFFAIILLAFKIFFFCFFYWNEFRHSRYSPEKTTLWNIGYQVRFWKKIFLLLSWNMLKQLLKQMMAHNQRISRNNMAAPHTHMAAVSLKWLSFQKIYYFYRLYTASLLIVVQTKFEVSRRCICIVYYIKFLMIELTFLYWSYHLLRKKQKLGMT